MRKNLGMVHLTDWQLCFHKVGKDGSAKCDLARRLGKDAYGVVYDISMDDKERLDRIEGVGQGYRVEQLVLPRFGSVAVYLADAAYIDAQLKPYDWYRAFVLSGARFHGFPAAYIEEIKATPFRIDPDSARRADNYAIHDAHLGERLHGD